MRLSSIKAVRMAQGRRRSGLEPILTYRMAWTGPARGLVVPVIREAVRQITRFSGWHEEARLSRLTRIAQELNFERTMLTQHSKTRTTAHWAGDGVAGRFSRSYRSSVTDISSRFFVQLSSTKLYFMDSYG